MARTWYIYSSLSERELTETIALHQVAFDEYIGDTFSDAELDQFAPQLDELASVTVGPVLEELSFEDLNYDPAGPATQRHFFETCRSSVCFEEVPFLESNPFQVSYLRELLSRIPEALVDAGEELLMKEAWLKELAALRGVEGLIKQTLTPAVVRASVAVPTHIDRMVREIYHELRRLRELGKLPVLQDLAPRRAQLLEAMLSNEGSADEVLRRSGLNPKDFGDGLEGLKFFLKKIV